MLDLRGGVADVDIGKGVRAALIADEHGIALGKISGVIRALEHLHGPAIGVLPAQGGDAFGDDGAARVFADVDHFGAGVGLLPERGDGDRVKFAHRVVALQNATRIFPRNGRAGLYLRPRDFGIDAPTRAAFGDEIVDAALAVDVAGIPVLHGGVLDLCIVQCDELDHRGVKLILVPHRRCATFQIRHISPLIGDDEGAFKLACVGRVDAEIRG